MNQITEEKDKIPEEDEGERGTVWSCMDMDIEKETKRVSTLHSPIATRTWGL